MQPLSKHTGFTVIEIIVVVAIALLLVAIALPNVLGSFSDEKLDTTTQYVTHFISLAQVHAATNKDNDDWGIHIVNGGTDDCDSDVAVDCIVLYKGTAFSSRDASFDRRFVLKGNNRFGALSDKDFYFNKVSGYAKGLQGFPANPLAYYSFANATTSDYSGNENHGTREGSMFIDSSGGAHGDSAYGVFNGAGDYSNLGNPPWPSGTAARSMCAWAKTDDVSTVPGYRWVVSYGAAAVGQAMFIGQNFVGTDLNGGAYGDDLIVSNFWDTSNWHHVCLTYDGTHANLYGDGVLLAGPTAKTWNLTLNNANIGRQVNNIENWDGNIDEVFIYGHALSADDVGSLFELTKPTSTYALPTSRVYVVNGSATSTIVVYPDGRVSLSR